MKFLSLKDSIFNPDLLTILSQSIYNPTPVRVIKRAEKYADNSNIFTYGLEIESAVVGVVVFEIKDRTIDILDIAVKFTEQRKGYGKTDYRKPFARICCE